MATKEEMKQKALDVMKELNIYKPYIKEFDKNNTVCLFERFAGFYIDHMSEPELDKAIKNFEEEYNCVVYAVTHGIFEFGECYDFLYVSQYEEDWEYIIDKYYNQNDFIVSAYVWNKDDDTCSEFGSIAVKSAYGGIVRVG